VSEPAHKTSRRSLPQLRDRIVLAILALISACLLFDSLLHLWVPSAELNRYFLHSASSEPLRVLLFVGQFVCGVYVWHRFRSEARIRRVLDRAIRERADEMTKFQNILESIPSPITIQSPDMRVIYQNPAHTSYAGNHVGEFCYRAYSRRDQICDACPLVETLGDGQVHTLQKSNLVKGEERHFELITAPLKKFDGTIVAAIEVVQDNTTSVRYQQHITNLSRRLEENNNELRAFGSALAHDLRQPLTRTYMAVQVLRDYSAALGDSGAEMLEMALQGCEQMEEMLEGMLMLSRVDNEELYLEPVDLAPLLEEILLDLRAFNPERQVLLHTPDVMEVIGDRSLLRILMQNLVGNAWKYSQGSDTTEIRVEVQKRAGVMEVVVQDNGIGFPEEQANELFRPFVRLHAEQGFPGTGIGLATARRVVHRHGGRIWAESAPGKGARFYFTLPLGDAIPTT